MARPAALLVTALVFTSLMALAATGTATSGRSTGDGFDGIITDASVDAAPPVAYQPATWTAEATVTGDTNVTRIDLDLRDAGSVDDVSAEDVRVAYAPPSNATLVLVGHPETVSVHDDGVLRLAFPDGIALSNGSRLTVHVDGATVPPDETTVSLAVTTPGGVYSASDSVDPAPVPHLEFYESFPEPGVHLRFGLAKRVSMIAVVYHEGEVVGTEYLDYDYAMTADGQPVPVEGVGGQTELTVRGYHDANGNGVYDPAVDRPYVGPDGEPIGETATIELPETTTATVPPTTDPGTGSTGTGITSVATDTTTSPAETPGFGVSAMLAALVVAIAYLARD